MKKRIITMMMAGVMVFSLCACGTAGADTKTAEPVQESEETSADETKEEEKVTLPPYEYPGPELFYSVLYQYLIDELSANYEKAEVSIPCPVIVAEDESNKDDIMVWGNFWIFNYNLNGDTLECESGGSYPGVIHVKSTDEGYEVTSMEVTEDGSGFEKSAKKIFGEHYDEFMGLGEDEDYRENIRAQIIANYVAANNLSIKEYKDYGWDPVALPEENIDSFYSKLD